MSACSPAGCCGATSSYRGAPTCLPAASWSWKPVRALTTGVASCARGIDARIVSAHLAAPYRQEGRCGKNDANDAAAVCEAGGRPRMRFVPVKSVEQQSMLCVHKLREGLKEERNACINRIRGLLAEFGLVFPQSPEVLRMHLPDALEDANN